MIDCVKLYEGKEMLDHDARWKFGLDFSKRMVRKYPGEIVASGIYGSTANGTDTLWSDLDMLFIVRDTTSLEPRHYIFNGISVGYDVIKEKDLLYNLQAPTLHWPYWMGVLSVMKLTKGNSEYIKNLLDKGRSVPQVKFRRLLEHSLPDMLIESYGRLFSCMQRDNVTDVNATCIEIVLELRDIVCIINQGWVVHDYYNGVEETFSFPKLPDGYRELVPDLWQGGDPEKLIPIAEKLYDNLLLLLKKEKIKIKNYASVNELPI